MKHPPLHKSLFVSTLSTSHIKARRYKIAYCIMECGKRISLPESPPKTLTIHNMVVSPMQH
jgi:hypothetical protein